MFLVGGLCRFCTVASVLGFEGSDWGFSGFRDLVIGTSNKSILTEGGPEKQRTGFWEVLVNRKQGPKNTSMTSYSVIQSFVVYTRGLSKH